jgi:hypothetical protein
MILQDPVCIRRHGAKLEALEEAAIVTNAAVSIKDTTAI